MLLRLILLLFIFTSCQSGLIPCPDGNYAKLKKSKIRNVQYVNRSSTSADQNSIHDRGAVPEQRIPQLKHVSVNEWDCPKPGQKRSAPKEVKQNIRKNQRLLRDYYKNRDSADTLQTLTSDRRP